MSEGKPSFGRRLVLAFSAFGRILADRDFAAGVERLRTGAPPPIEEMPVPPPPPPPALKEAVPDAALQLLGLLQRDGRLVDFLEEDVAQYSDAEIGAAVRVVHEGCRKTLHDHFRIEPIYHEAEGARVSLEPGFDAAAVRLTGNVAGEPPFRGVLVHRGWRVTEVRLPKLSAEHDTRVLAAAEVEL